MSPNTCLSSSLSLVLLAASAWSQGPAYTLPGSFSGDAWGSSAAVVGDVDGDGRDDFAVGSTLADYQVFFPVPHLVTDVGRVNVYSGATGNFLWSHIGSLVGGDDFGAAICGAGDVNGDGRDDVLISAPRADGPALRGGVVYLYSGADGALLRTLYGLQSDALFGAAIAAGDVDGDGSPDCIVGSPQANIDGPFGAPLQEGRVRIFRLNNGSLIGDWPGTDYGSFGAYDRMEWGRSVAFLGDVDGDGMGEIVVGAPASNRMAGPGGPFLAQTGFLRVFEPATDFGPGSNPTHFGGAAGERLGTCLASVSSGFTLARFLAGAPGYDGGKGAMRVVEVTAVPIFGPSIIVTPTLLFPGSLEVPLGTRCAAPGDVNGDGSPDYLFGSPLGDKLSSTFPPLPVLDVGVVRVHSGSNGSLIRTLIGANAGDKLGEALAGGNLNGDGFADLVVGASGVDSTASNAGEAYAYLSLPCSQSASVNYYGVGLAGTLGLPSLNAGATPVLGTSVNMQTTSSVASATTAFMAIGYAEVAVPFLGGTLLVNPVSILVYPVPSTGSTLTWSIAPDPSACGLDVHLQSALLDAGAPQGLAFTRGVRMHIGL